MLMVQKLNNFKGKFLLSGYENEIYNKLNNANKIKIKNNEILWKIIKIIIDSLKF